MLAGGTGGGTEEGGSAETGGAASGGGAKTKGGAPPSETGGGTGGTPDFGFSLNFPLSIAGGGLGGTVAPEEDVASEPIGGDGGVTGAVGVAKSGGEGAIT